MVTGNSMLGTSTGQNIVTGADNNTFVGYQSGQIVSTGAHNVLIGATSTGSANLTTGSNNISLGYDISLPSATANNQLNIGNIIYGTGVDGSGSILSTGNVGIGTTAPDAKLTISGQMYSKLVAPSLPAIDFNTGNSQTITLGSNVTITFSSGKAGAVYTLIVKQNGTGGYTATWPASVKWPGGVAPVLSSTANAVDVFTFVSDGTNYYNMNFAADVK